MSDRMNMNCETARTLLVGLSDREPVGRQPRELTRHLERCAECRALLEALKQDRETLRGMPPLEPSERLLGRVMTQVRQTEQVARPALSGFLRVAAAILLFLAGIGLGVVIGHAISPRDTHPIDRIAALMASETAGREAGNPLEVQ